LEAVKAAREKRWPPPSYAGPRNVRVLTLHNHTTIRLVEYLYLFLTILKKNKQSKKYQNRKIYILAHYNVSKYATTKAILWKPATFKTMAKH